MTLTFRYRNGLAILLLAASCSAPAPEVPTESRLEKIGPAPAFDLLSQTGSRLSSETLRGKVVVVTFVYTGCVDTCAFLTSRLARQARVADGVLGGVAPGGVRQEEILRRVEVVEDAFLFRAVQIHAPHGDGHHLGARGVQGGDHRRVVAVFPRPDHES